MNDPENFLARWSRRKREGGENDPPAPADSGVAPAAQSGVPAATPGAAAHEEAPERDVDLSSLPPVETIAADTDIRAFLAPGVPMELRLAALRRAWAADPKIRDFVGLADYDWDFHTPGAMAGFGPLQMTDALRREVARIVSGSQPHAVAGEASEVATGRSGDASDGPAAGLAAPVASEPTEAAASSDVPSPTDLRSVGFEAAPAPSLVQRSETNVATRQEPAPSPASPERARRPHGRALPR
ncbi:MAG: DUF3306 domain-containing protein [Hyphomicrobiales bacterium]|nr:DUF3306 domain-containing protein [Hyphomicrobiales bacterium]